MKLKRIVPGFVGSNCYILINEGFAVVIDPSAPTSEIMKVLADESAKLLAILLTHGHFDHMLSLERLRAENPQAQVMIHATDAELMSDGHKNAFYEFFKRDRDFGSPDRLLIEGDIISIGNEKLQVMHTPGHTSGSVCYRCRNLLFSGDTIMADGYGRCDLYSGNSARMNATLNKLKSLAEKSPKLTIYPGHGEFALLSDAIEHISHIQ